VYDAAGNVLAQIDQLGHATSYSYDTLERQVTATDANTHITTIAYDAAGNQTTVTDPDGNVTTMVYDALDRQTAMTDPLNHTATYAYDAADILISTTDRDGRLDTYTYDALERETGATWRSSTGTTTNVQTFTYDAAGNQLTAADFSGAYTMAYDALDRMTSVAEPYSQLLTFAYDAASNRTLMQDSQGGTTTSVYDALGRLTTREFGGTGQTPLRENLTYNANDQITTESRYTDLNGTQLAGTSSYVYDSAQRLTNLTQSDKNGNVLASYVYNYDPASRLTSEVGNGGSPITYTYDPTNQLTAVATGTGTTNYNYDPNGNPSGDSIGTGNQILNDGTWTYTYDAEGNLIEKSQGSSAPTWVYTYDNNNRLLTAIETSQGTGGTTLATATYVYDVFGNRLASSEWTSSTGTVTTSYAYDGTNAWADLSSMGALVTRRLYLDGADQMMALVSGAGVAQWYLTDRQGSVRDLVNYGGTMVLDQIQYDAFGNTTSQSNSANQDAYGWDGYRQDPVTGQYVTYARQYSPGTGRFTTQDPSRFAAGDPNLYRYVGNDPNAGADSSGLGATHAPLDGSQQEINWTAPRSFWQQTVDGSATCGDAVSGGLTRHIRTGLDFNDVVDPNSTGGRIGNVAGEGINLGLTIATPSGGACRVVGWARYGIRGLNGARAAGHALSAGEAARRHDFAGVTGNLMAGRASLDAATTTCFPAGTPLLTPDGEKLIEQFRIRDLVLSRHEYEPTGHVTAKQVENVIIRVAPVLELRVLGRTIRVTAEHPFWVCGQGWQKAEFLAPGNELLGHDGRRTAVESVTETAEVMTVYNLQVAEYHTYFVGGEDWGFSVWAHNADYGEAADVRENGDRYGVRERGRNVPGSRPGSNGNVDHQEGVAQAAQDARNTAGRGERVLEQTRVQGFPSTRRPDVQIVDPNGRARLIIEVERRPNSRFNLEREAEYNRLGIPNTTRPIQ
jgi:RHS repeat-associated protein